MGRTVGELESSMSSAEWSEWLAFDRVYGLPDLNAYQANICSVVATAMGGKHVRLGEFLLKPMPARRRRRKRLTPEQTVGILGRTLNPSTNRSTP